MLLEERGMSNNNMTMEWYCYRAVKKAVTGNST
jgi:hypothetical protein